MKAMDEATKQALNNQSSSYCSFDNNVDLLNLVQQLQLELKKRDDKIASLEKIILGESMYHNKKQSNKEKKENVESAPLHRSIQMYSKKILFHGRNTNEKPRPKDITQIHYTITTATTTKEMKVIEDSRETRNGQPFEFILDHGQIIKEWEDIIKDMCRGQIIVVKMNVPCGNKSFPSLTSVEGCCSDTTTTCQSKHHEYSCRIELINFWEYEQPFRPWILEL